MKWYLFLRDAVLHPGRFLKNIARFYSELRKFKKAGCGFDFKVGDNLYPCLNDWNESAANLNYYFWQDLWAAKKIFSAAPERHFDIGSRVDGFIAHVLSFMPVTMIDIRPLPWKIEGLDFIQADATTLEGIEDNSILSLSSLCAIEHFGLGRYGDPLSPDAWVDAMRSLSRVLAVGGHLYLAVPIGSKNEVVFNAHRIFSPETVLNVMKPLSLDDFSVIDTRNMADVRYLEHVAPDECVIENNFHGMVVGLFDFVKTA